MDLLEWAKLAIEDHGYWAIGLVLIVLAPEAIMPFAGFLAYEGVLGLWLSILVGTLGGSLGSTLIYLLARRLGEHRIRDLLTAYGHMLLLRDRDLDVVLGLFARQGRGIIAMGRLVPSLRSLVSVPAGLLPMGLPEFVFFTFVGTLFWNAVLALAGFALGAGWDLLEPYLGIYGATAIALLVLILGVLALRRLAGLALGR